MPVTFTPRTIHINRIKLNKESCAGFFSQILLVHNLFLLICLPFLTLNKCLFCLDSTLWSFFTAPLPHKRQCCTYTSPVPHLTAPQLQTRYSLGCIFTWFSKPKVPLRRLGSFRHNIRLYRPEQKQYKTICHFCRMCPYVCGLWFYENRLMGKDKVSSDMTSGCHSKSQVSPCMPDSNINQSKRKTCFGSFSLNL